MKSQEFKHALVILQSFNLVFLKLPKDKLLRSFIYKNIFVVFFVVIGVLKINSHNADGISWVC
jgi:hypothetical protein